MKLPKVRIKQWMQNGEPVPSNLGLQVQLEIPGTVQSNPATEKSEPKTPEQMKQWADAEKEDFVHRQREWQEHVRRQRLAKSHQLIKEQNEDGTADY